MLHVAQNTFDVICIRNSIGQIDRRNHSSGMYQQAGVGRRWLMGLVGGGGEVQISVGGRERGVLAARGVSTGGEAGGEREAAGEGWRCGAAG